jgi:hypothetical protein
VPNVAVYRQSDGIWYVSRASGGTLSAAWGGNRDLPVTGDYNGDGKTDYAYYRPWAGTWHILFAGTTTQSIVQWGVVGDTPVMARR